VSTGQGSGARCGARCSGRHARLSDERLGVLRHLHVVATVLISVFYGVRDRGRGGGGSDDPESGTARIGTSLPGRWRGHLHGMSRCRYGRTDRRGRRTSGLLLVGRSSSSCCFGYLGFLLPFRRSTSALQFWQERKLRRDVIDGGRHGSSAPYSSLSRWNSRWRMMPACPTTAHSYGAAAGTTRMRASTLTGPWTPALPGGNLPNGYTAASAKCPMSSSRPTSKKNSSSA